MARHHPFDSRICTDVSAAADRLRSGRLVAFPTETVYGLGADATNPRAVAEIFETKGRPRFDPLIVHVADFAMAQRISREFSEIARRLVEKFWPGPLTVVVPKSGEIPDIVTAGLPGVGIRMPRHEMALELIRQARRPIAAPSANPFSGISPTTARHVAAGLASVEFILDGGPCSVGVESTVISLMGAEPVLLRPGGTSSEEIESVIGPVRVACADTSRPDAAQPAPGMLSRHYAPGTRLHVIPPDATARPEPGCRSGLLTWGSDRRFEEGFETVERLSDDDDLKTCATRLFAAMRSLDARNLDVIIAHGFPQTGIGLALNDRLQRASTKVS